MIIGQHIRFRIGKTHMLPLQSKQHSYDGNDNKNCGPVSQDKTSYGTPKSYTEKFIQIQAALYPRKGINSHFSEIFF
jgi:hypothetical protein